MSDWKVIYVNSRAEKKVAERLSQSGIECYVPLKKEIRKWSDRKKTVVLPMINGYVFVKPTQMQRNKVLEHHGVIQFVRYNKADAIVREPEIEVLRAIEQKGYFVEGAFGASLKIGDSARIGYGQFKGLKGIVKSGSSEDTYLIAIESMDYCLTLKVPKEILEKFEQR